MFTFHLKREPDSSSFSILATKLFHIAGPCIDIRNLLLRSPVFVCYNLRLRNVLDMSEKSSERLYEKLQGLFHFLFYA